eukprot:TRINITY_DN7157_c0_g1_i1.p1 TRINITY_DN7157_c0_g1~~TRINITY_DN7157_c0_g1_i1.p1  ORF type:complete len:203 (+),score=10.88 TRINITY_DN7157_c0_g1_i1:836-1444(+)
MELEITDPSCQMNILELLCQLDDVLLVKIMIEMDPMQMIILGTTCRRFYELASDRKLWKQVIIRQGLLPALMKKKGGKKNLKRVQMMKITFKNHIQAPGKEQRKAKIEAEFYQALKDRHTKELYMYVFDELNSKLGPCIEHRGPLHPTITYDRKEQKAKCTACLSFITDYEQLPIVESRYLKEYLHVAKPTADVLTFERPEY